VGQSAAEPGMSTVPSYLAAEIVTLVGKTLEHGKLVSVRCLGCAPSSTATRALSKGLTAHRGISLVREEPKKGATPKPPVGANPGRSLLEADTGTLSRTQGGGRRPRISIVLTPEGAGRC
jgi:hypothetical protein